MAIIFVLAMKRSRVMHIGIFWVLPGYTPEIQEDDIQSA